MAPSLQQRKIWLLSQPVSGCIEYPVLYICTRLCVFCRLSEACLEETVAHLVAALLLNTRSITDDTVARMDADAQEVSRCFAKFQKPERVRMIPYAVLRPPPIPTPPPLDLSLGGVRGDSDECHLPPSSSPACLWTGVLY